jgi:hypothetical protein
MRVPTIYVFDFDYENLEKIASPYAPLLRIVEQHGQRAVVATVATAFPLAEEAGPLCYYRASYAVRRSADAHGGGGERGEGIAHATTRPAAGAAGHPR